MMQPQSSKNAGNATCEVSLNADVARLLRKTGRWRGKTTAKWATWKERGGFRMHFIVSVIAEMAAEIISSTMGILFYAFLFKLIFHRKPKKTKEIQANEHVYYPVRFYVPFAKLLCEYIAFMY